MSRAMVPEPDNVIVLTRPDQTRQWVQDRLKSYSETKAKIVFLLILLVGLLGGPALIWQGLAGFLSVGAGTSGGGAAALAFNQFLIVWLSMIAFALLAKILAPLRHPAKLVLGEGSIKLIWQCGIPWRAQELPWSSVVSVSIRKKLTRFTRPTTHILFSAENGKTLSFDLSYLPAQERAWLLAAIEKHCNHASLSPELTLSLMPLPERCFTELWLAGLSEPLQLEGPGELAGPAEPEKQQ